MKIIFLDVDGVLNSNTFCRNTRMDINEVYVERLSRIYHSGSDIKIVLSSSWKIFNEATNASMKELLRYLSKYDMEVIDRTPWAYYDTGEYIGSRPMEILEWMRHKNIDVRKCISIEDDFWPEDYEAAKTGLSDMLIQTSFWGDSEEECGIKESDVQKAINALKRGDTVEDKDK